MSINNLGDGNGAAKVKITAKDFSAKYRSTWAHAFYIFKYYNKFYIGKREVYTFLSVDVGVYLPSYEQCTIYFLKDIMQSKKKSK